MFKKMAVKIMHDSIDCDNDWFCDLYSKRSTFLQGFKGKYELSSPFDFSYWDKPKNRQEWAKARKELGFKTGKKSELYRYAFKSIVNDCVKNGWRVSYSPHVHMIEVVLEDTHFIYYVKPTTPKGLKKMLRKWKQFKSGIAQKGAKRHD